MIVFELKHKIILTKTLAPKMAIQRMIAIDFDIAKMILKLDIFWSWLFCFDAIECSELWLIENPPFIALNIGYILAAGSHQFARTKNRTIRNIKKRFAITKYILAISIRSACCILHTIAREKKRCCTSFNILLTQKVGVRSISVPTQYRWMFPFFLLENVIQLFITLLLCNSFKNDLLINKWRYFPWQRKYESYILYQCSNTLLTLSLVIVYLPKGATVKWQRKLLLFIE